MMKKSPEKYKQNKLSQVNIKKREKITKKMYLSEIIELEKSRFGKNNLILSPVGSGKSHSIEEKLIPEDFNKKILYLTTNSTLKDFICPNDNEIRKKLSEKGESVNFFTSENISEFGDKPYNVHVMTYAEFGEKIKPSHQTFTDDIGLVFCDEIHSLLTNFTYEKSHILEMALYWLMKEHEDKQIFYFSATRENIDKLEKYTPGYFNHVQVLDYLNHPEIRKYIAKSTYFINHISQLRSHLKARLEYFNYSGAKALAFTEHISEQYEIEKIAKEEGFNPIILWSIDNELKMSEEQLNVRNHILTTGLIPEPYNILIINGAMQEGWILYDEAVDLAILDITEQVQSLGGIRKDIDYIIKN